MNANRRQWTLILLGLFVFAALLRIGFVLTLQHGFYFWDSVRYDNAAVHLLQDGTLGSDYNRSPVYPMYLAGVYFVFGRSILVVRIIESLLGAAIAVILAAIGRRLLGPATGFFAGLIW